MAGLRQRLAYSGLTIAIGLGGLAYVTQNGGLAGMLRERMPARFMINQDSRDILLQKAVEDATYRGSYLESVVSGKPENVDSVYYDHLRNVANGSAKRSAMVVSTRYYQRFDEEGIEKELAEFLKDSNLYKNMPPELAEREIRNSLTSRQGREALVELIERNVYSKIVDYIRTSDAVAILVSYHALTKKPQYQLFVFPSAFETKDGRKPTTESIRDIIQDQFDSATRGLVFPN